MEPFNVRFEFGTSRWQADWLHIGILQDRSERIAESAISVDQDISLVAQEPLEWIGEVAGHLFHEGIAQRRRTAS